MSVEEFIHWMATADPEHRVESVHPLTSAYLAAAIDSEQRDGLEAVMLILLDDPDPAVRHALAVALAEAPEAPHAIVLALANDEPEIAAVVVGHSPILIDTELVDIVATAEPMVQAAAAGRLQVSPALAAAVAEVGEAYAQIALLSNLRAAIPYFSLMRIVERFGRDPAVCDAILARPGVPIEIRQFLLEQMSVAMQNLVVLNAWMREDRAENVTRDACDKATVALAATASDPELQALVEHLRQTGRLTTALMLRAVCTGNIRLVTEALANLAGMPSARVFALIEDGREAAFRALYKKAGLAPRAYPAFQVAIEVNREIQSEFAGVAIDDARFSRCLIERVIARYCTEAPDGLDDLVASLRRFAAEAARDAARSFVSRTLMNAPALAAPTDAELAGEPVLGEDRAGADVWAA